MNDYILPIGTAIGGILLAAATAWVTLRKSKTETDKAVRNGVLEEWRVITDRLQVTIKEQDGEIKALRTEIVKLYAEMSVLRAQVVVRETERIEQRGDIRSLEKKVTELKKPDAEALADAIVPKLAEALALSPDVPVTSVPPKEEKPKQ